MTTNITSTLNSTIGSKATRNPKDNLIYKLRTLMWRVKKCFYREDIKKCNLYKHALTELDYAGYFKPDDDGEAGEGMNKLMADNVLELIEVFAKQGHSGYSSQFCVSLFESLAKYQPLVPLTGEDREWSDVSGPSGYLLWQNKRCSHVFKGEDGKAYDLDGRIFREPNGACYTNIESRVFIEFPYTPKREYVDVPASE